MIGRSRFRSLAAAGREVLSVARQALLLPRDTVSPALPRGIATTRTEWIAVVLGDPMTTAPAVTAMKPTVAAMASDVLGSGRRTVSSSRRSVFSRRKFFFPWGRV